MRSRLTREKESQQSNNSEQMVRIQSDLKFEKERGDNLQASMREAKVCMHVCWCVSSAKVCMHVCWCVTSAKECMHVCWCVPLASKLNKTFQRHKRIKTYICAYVHTYVRTYMTSGGAFRHQIRTGRGKERGARLEKKIGRRYCAGCKGVHACMYVCMHVCTYRRAEEIGC